MPDPGGHKTIGRSLPSWMSSRDNDHKSDGKEPANDKAKQHTGATTSQNHILENGSKTKSSESNFRANKSSKLLDGVVFVLSGFVNPERSTLRSQSLEMGAEYQADWNSNCTLLVCAFSNTPKFRQVETDCGTIVSKEWITKCYEQKELVDIEPYLMHAGKPWRRQSSSTGSREDPKQSSSKDSYKQEDKASNRKPLASSSSKKQAVRKHAKDEFSPADVKKWVVDDLERTISWLDSQEEKPGPSEIKKIAAEGILTCLQDAIDALKEGQGLEKIMEQWNFVPRVIEELIQLQRAAESSASNPVKNIHHQAIACKRIYEDELGCIEDDIANKKKRPKTEKGKKGDKGKTRLPSSKAADYDSDETIEMTEDEIGEAYNTVASSFVNDKNSS